MNSRSFATDLPAFPGGDVGYTVNAFLKLPNLIARRILDLATIPI